MLEFVVIVEAQADFDIATVIAERIFSERGPEWLEEYLSEKFCWSGLEQNQAFTCWTHIKHIENQAKTDGYRLPKYLGHAKSGPQKTHSSAAQKALFLAQYFRRKERNIQAVIFIRDLDNQPERREGLEQARDEFNTLPLQPLQIVIGTADPNREAWVLNGFEAEDDSERKALEDIQNEIKFNPCTESHRLRSPRKEAGSRNIKDVLKRLTVDNSERETQCWLHTDLNVLKDRGQQTGLTQFIKEVEERLLPLLTE